MALTIKFDLFKCDREFTYKDRNKICEGCTIDLDGRINYEPELIATFDNKEAALEALKNYESRIERSRGWNGSLFNVTEYYIQENWYDEDGEWTDSPGILKFSPLPDIEEGANDDEAETEEE